MELKKRTASKPWTTDNHCFCCNVRRTYLLRNVAYLANNGQVFGLLEWRTYALQESSMVVDFRHPRRLALIDPVPVGQAVADLDDSASPVRTTLSTFDYSALPPHVQFLAKEAANKICTIHKKQLEGILEIGHVLNSMKKTLAHGTYLDWLREELRLEPRTAQNYAMAAEVFYGKSEIVSHLKITKIYALSRAVFQNPVPSNPDHSPKRISSTPVEMPAKPSFLVAYLVALAGFDLTTLVTLLKTSGYMDLAIAVDAEATRLNKRPSKSGTTPKSRKRSPPKV